MSSTNHNPLVSVCVITFNQEAYIEECLKSILCQETKFEFDIVVGEDCSSDATAKIIESLSNNHQNIQLLDNHINLGVLPNFIRTLNECKGKYIAFCEGDDYWIDAHKLQKQVDFLEANKQYGGVSTNNRWFFEKENTFKDSLLDEGEITFKDLCQKNLINSQTALFRRELLKKIDWLKDLEIGDWALHLLITSQQPYYRLSDITTVYRVHEGGTHSLLKEEFKIRNRIEVLITILKHVDLTLKRKDLVKASIRDLLKKLMNYNSKDLKAARNKYFEYGGSFFNKTIFKSYIHELF